MDDGDALHGHAAAKEKGMTDQQTHDAEMRGMLDALVSAVRGAVRANVDDYWGGTAYTRVLDHITKLQAFKDFVHRRLDTAGIPTHPDGPHSKEGCRIGDRLDLVIKAAGRWEWMRRRSWEICAYHPDFKCWSTGFDDDIIDSVADERIGDESVQNPA